MESLSGGEIERDRHQAQAAPFLLHGGEDRISALPDDVLVLILLRLDAADAAGRTSALSRRWRRVWALLPELRFPADADPHRVRAALSAHEADLRCLHVGTRGAGAAPELVAAWLRVAAPRLSGSLTFRNRAADEDEEEEEESGAFELPCFVRATAISLDLGFLGLAVPPAGVFARLTDLALERVSFHGPCELGDAVSSPRCPCLQKLFIDAAYGLRNLAIHSESLTQVKLMKLLGLRKLTLVAPALRQLAFHGCFAGHKSVANISAHQLQNFQWGDPGSVQLGKMTQLQRLIPGFFHVYCKHRRNRSIVRLLKQIRFTRILGLVLIYPRDIGDFQYVMEDLTVFPHLMGLNLMIINNGHSFGASVFHLLRMRTGLKALGLGMDIEAQSACPQGCICDEPSNWMTEELTLNCLQHVVIRGMKGADNEVTFLERLFHWATVLETMSIIFDCSISESKAWEVLHTLSSFSRPETRMEFYMQYNESRESRYLLAPDEDHGV